LIPLLQSLIAVQALDSAAEARRRRMAELPAAEREIDARLKSAAAAVEAVKAKLNANTQARRELEKQVAQADTRLARFDEHKAAVKTNQEYTALLHEIAGAKSEKDAVEEQILVLLESADTITAELKAAEAALAQAQLEGKEARGAIEVERGTLKTEIDGLMADRARESATIPAPILLKYDQLLKQRKMLAVVPIEGELCTACHVRLRPAVALQVRRNDGIVQCDSCQRMLYAVPKEPA
jgi:predicted  nucleic acid-binding Zn-ribbon protein